MELLRLIVSWLAAASLVVAAVQIYLIVNKVWIRKHEPEVAASISIAGETLGLVPLCILTLSFILDGQWAGAADGLMWITGGLVTIAIGSGMWVEGKRGRAFWDLVKDALRVERDEVGSLAARMFRPSGARAILDILGQIALIDQELDPRERDFIDGFAEAWGIELDWDEVLERVDAEELSFVTLRESVAGYLATSPPRAQVSQLSDVVGALVRIDEVLSSEEELILEELEGMFDAYVEGDAGEITFGVAIVPQDTEQDRAISQLLPGVSKRSLEGGRAYVKGPFHSERYADLVAEQYRSLNFFTTVVRM